MSFLRHNHLRSYGSIRLSRSCMRCSSNNAFVRTECQKENRRPSPPSPDPLPAASQFPVRESVTDDDVDARVESGKWKFFDLENHLGLDFERAVRARRYIVQKKTQAIVENLPFQNYNYAAIHGQCCENVIGYVPIPVGVAGPLKVDGKEYYIPLATTEGALVASTTRGCKALTMSGGVSTEIISDGMSRAPVVQVKDIKMAAAVKKYVDNHFQLLSSTFNATSRYARLSEIKTFIAGRKVFFRFKATTGDAMGMNMISKGVEETLKVIHQNFPEMEILSVSGNVCTDKKPSAVNWVEGRGKSIIADCVLKGEIIQNILKTSVDRLVNVNYSKNLIGSAVAGSIGGFNAHASNIVTAIFLATGQDPAQNVESSTCMTQLEEMNDGKDIYMSITMPAVEVGTVGGGTQLPGQSACLGLLGVKGPNKEKPGANAQQLARLVGATVMAGELSLLAALTTNSLVSSHLHLNRKSSSSDVSLTNT